MSRHDDVSVEVLRGSADEHELAALLAAVTEANVATAAVELA